MSDINDYMIISKAEYNRLKGSERELLEYINLWKHTSTNGVATKGMTLDRWQKLATQCIGGGNNECVDIDELRLLREKSEAWNALVDLACELDDIDIVMPRTKGGSQRDFVLEWVADLYASNEALTGLINSLGRAFEAVKQDKPQC
jgi:hypothetical protein